MKQVAILLHTMIMVVCAAFVMSCQEEIMHRGRTPLVSVGKEFLYVEDVERFYSANPSAADSARYVDEFINRWIEEALFYYVALRNVPSSDKIDRLVEGYRRSLVLNLYQDGLVEQHLRNDIIDEEVQAFYKANSQMFEVEEPIMMGIFLRVKKGAPKLSSLRKWY